MRILIYWEQESWGGVDSHLLTLLSLWPEPSDAITLLVNRGNAGFARIRPQLAEIPNLYITEIDSSSFNQLNFRCRRFPVVGSLLARLCYFLQPLLFARSVAQLRSQFVAQGEFDVILSNNGGYPGAWGALAAIEAAYRIGIPARVLLVHHAATTPALFMGWHERMNDRRIGRATSAIVCVSKATKATLLAKRFFDDEQVRLRVIHNGVMPLKPDAQATDLRAAVSGQRRFLIGMLGRVERYKGHEDVLFALARLPEDVRAQFGFAVIGSGEPAEIERLRRLAEDLGVAENTAFLGYLPCSSGSLVAQLDLLIVATRSFEGFGLTIAEAMQAGVPVLATAVGAIPEFVASDNGMLVEPNAPDQLAAGLQAYAENADAWKSRAQQARAGDKVSGAKMAAAYHSAFAELILVGRESR